MNAHTAAILLAAGLSSRMGSPKPLLPWDARPLVCFQVAQLHAAGCDDIVVVVGHEAAAVERALVGAPARAVFNTEYQAGRATSIRAGAAALSSPVDAVLMLNVDQPRPAALIRWVLDQHHRWAQMITIPEYQGKGGHPIALSGALVPELAAVTEAGEGLRSVVRRHAAATRRIPTDDPLVVLDVNTPERYAEARRIFDLPAPAIGTETTIE